MSIDSQSQYLVQKWNEKHDSDPNAVFTKYIIAIAGVPGSGKTTLSEHLVNRINSTSDVKATYLPMDGFHLYRWQLDAMADPEEARKRRGAPFTFDGKGYVAMVKELCQTGKCTAPDFDHALKDPIPNAINVGLDDSIVILEGNYLLLKEEPWCELKEWVDERWFIDCDIDVAMERVAKRAVEAGIEPNEKMAWSRVDYNDRPNGIYIINNSFQGDRRISCDQG